jgi:hypothetical protein
MKGLNFAEIKRLKIDGFEAGRFEVTGTVNKMRFGYVFSIIDTPDTYFQITARTLEKIF